MSHHPHPPKTALKYSARNFDLRNLVPFPNYFIDKEELPVICRCIYDGTKFYVLHTKDILTLYHNGAFGKSKLTHRAPVMDQNDDIYKSQAYFKKAALASEKLLVQYNYEVPVNTVVLSHNDSNSLTTSATTTSCSSTTSTTIINTATTSEATHTNSEVPKDLNLKVNSNEPNIDDRKEIQAGSSTSSSSSSSSSNNNNNSINAIDSSSKQNNVASVNHIQQKDNNTNENRLNNEKERNKTVESNSSSSVHDQKESYEEDMLILLPEEVIFLTFGVGCLTTQDSTGNILSYQTLWELLVKQNPEFPYLYAVYHYFRCKNWVPKLGHSFGGDYVLYEYGPKFSHASFVVHIFGSPQRAQPTWMEIYARQRTALHSSKLALICNVTTPKNFVPSTPMSIFQLKIDEMAIHRWTP